MDYRNEFVLHLEYKYNTVYVNQPTSITCFSCSTWQAYCHFIGVDPAYRGRGVGKLLYDQFFDLAKSRGCTMVRAVTHPVNVASVAFHRRLGFETMPVDQSTVAVDNDGGDVESSHEAGEVYTSDIPLSLVHVDYDGPQNGDRVLLEKHL